jgi:low temperature requirement protein LtrA
VDITDSFEFYLTFFLGILSVVFLQYLYFKSQPHDADGHVMRRSRPAATVYAALLQFYSAALIVVGVSYKMLLTEYSYEESVDKDAGSDYASNNLLTRLLASGGDGSPKYSMEERRQRISIFFCVGLAIIFLCLDLMTFAHIGFEGLKKSCYCPNHGHLLVSRIFFTVVLRFAVVIATGTACLYVTEPDSVALIGFASILVQIFFRIIRKILSSRKTSDLNHDEEIEGHWPNTTQPMSIPSDDKFENEEE